jgi:hypothetical protein
LCPSPRRRRHRLDPARDHDIGIAGLDAVSGEGDGLGAGRAETVDRDGGDFGGESGGERYQTGDVHSLLAFGHRAAENDVVHDRLVEPRGPFNEPLEHF